MKQWARYLFTRNHLSQLPRIIQAEDLTVKVGYSEIEIFTVEDTKAILNAAPERVKLYILLALNCGFTQKDIADLKVSEFDSEAGTITRKRSKTKDHEKTPTITWTLWPETLAAVNANLSGDSERLFLNAQPFGFKVMLLPIMDGREIQRGKHYRTGLEVQGVEGFRR